MTEPTGGPEGGDYSRLPSFPATPRPEEPEPAPRGRRTLLASTLAWAAAGAFVGFVPSLLAGELDLESGVVGLLVGAAVGALLGEFIDWRRRRRRFE
jgi:hypothetical protein